MINTDLQEHNKNTLKHKSKMDHFKNGMTLDQISQPLVRYILKSGQDQVG